MKLVSYVRNDASTRLSPSKASRGAENVVSGRRWRTQDDGCDDDSDYDDDSDEQNCNDGV